MEFSSTTNVGLQQPSAHVDIFNTCRNLLNNAMVRELGYFIGAFHYFNDQLLVAPSAALLTVKDARTTRRRNISHLERLSGQDVWAASIIMECETVAPAPEDLGGSPSFLSCWSSWRSCTEWRWTGKRVLRS